MTFNYDTADDFNSDCNRFDSLDKANDLLTFRYKLNRTQQHYLDLWSDSVSDLTPAQQRKAFKLAWLTK